ncbi:DUF6691 family protein [Pseudooceanicola algae]|uniref:YeeE/YedE family protein n=1 Tax=Pseudooceanicola algae TaxID=1537215 RepID=A0A418SEH0_9RHOB|nr:DUF6691 family protein [Pseudooceanicola algae]QPM89602.1 hypothetical protein PSAL_008230 [Pseudooceanicola algae]
MRIVLYYFVGLLFGLGISVSGMINPAKVFNFFDVAGSWDPSLAFVMGGGLAVALPGFAIVQRGARPLFGSGFLMPQTSVIDLRLIGGSAVFGIGWGLAGFCPGAAIPALGTGQPQVFLFVAALLGGMWLARQPWRRIGSGTLRAKS